jgi:2,5-diketo-D-gluconate reductase A
VDQQIPDVTLRDGTVIPQLGFGTWQVPNDDCPRIVGEAIRLGYRAIDTAQGYGNEAGVGRAIAESGLPRSAFVVTSKLRNGAHARDDALRAFDETLRAVGGDYLDVFLIHWPVPEQDKFVEAWRTLIELQGSGRVRAIGVSNFDRDQLERITHETGVAPLINQIELHPRFQQRDLRGYHLRRNIQLVSWSPLGPQTAGTLWWADHGRSSKAAGLFEDPVIKSLAEKHRKTPAQIIIRWHIQDGLVLNPKSVNPERIAENIGIFDFTLDAEDMYRIEAMDDPEGGRIGATPKDWNRIF